MPGGALRAELEGAVGRYLTSPLVYDILLVLAPGQARGIRLGAPGSGLGLTAFLSPRPERETRVVSQAAS
jgi:predicted component of type VI protein secretion system